MELLRRRPGDEFVEPGEMVDVRRRLRGVAGRHDLVSVVANAFDWRTRMLPFLFVDTRMVPAGVRAVGSALAGSGFAKTRIVLGQWNRRFRPSRARLDGRRPDLFLVSSMQIHTAPCVEWIRDMCRLPPDERPLIVAGGPKAIYEPWGVFGTDPGDPWGADVAVTGESYVLLRFLEVVLAERAAGEPLRAAFLRARDSGALDEVPGLVYPRGEADGVAEELVDTGIQRLVADLDELPDPVPGFSLLEPPSRRETLSPRAIPPDKVRRHSGLATLVLTLGCRFGCPYCPIPAYNQGCFRAKSGERVADEMYGLYKAYGIRHFFGADDNFFNDPARTLDIVEALVRTERQGIQLRKKMRWATEVTVADTLRMKDYLRAVRKAGVRALWLGVEDMTATFIRKGQTSSRTLEAFEALRARGIAPMPMLMHHDGQPLISRGGKPYGLINQARLLRKAGACTIQALSVTPAPGSKWVEEAYREGLVIESAGGRPVEPHMIDGNYVVASRQRRPWKSQLNLLATYAYFYNPARLLTSLFLPKSSAYLLDCGPQFLGTLGLMMNTAKTLGWARRLRSGEIRRAAEPPASRIPMRRPDGGPAAHGPPGASVASASAARS